MARGSGYVRKGEAGTRFCLSIRKLNTPKQQMTIGIRAGIGHYGGGRYGGGRYGGRRYGGGHYGGNLPKGGHYGGK